MTDHAVPAALSNLQAIDEMIQRRIEERLALLGSTSNGPRRGLALIVFSGELDKLIAAFTLATAAASMGMGVSMFFTFWGLVAIKRGRSAKRKDWIGKILTAMLPSSPARTHTSHMNCLGVGPHLIKYLMKKHQAASLEELIRCARELGVRFVACASSMELMSVQKEDFIEGLEYAGAATFLSAAADSAITLFI